MSPAVIDVAAIAAQVLAAPEVAREQLTISELAARTPMLNSLRPGLATNWGLIGIAEELLQIEVVRLNPTVHGSGWIAYSGYGDRAVSEKANSRAEAVRLCWQSVVESMDHAQGVAA